MNQMSVYSLFAVCLVTLLAAPAEGQEQEPATTFNASAFDAYVHQAVKDWDVPGLSIAVIKDDEVVFMKGYGVRELGKPAAVDENTLFAAASTTKAFTAAAIGMLVDEGKLDWDDPVVAHVPSFSLAEPYLTANVTVRDLLTHRSGLPTTGFLWSVDSEMSAQDMFDRLVHVDATYPLRDGFDYQNIMYALAGQVVENVSGMSWNDFVETRIFDPLGMERSTTRKADAEKKDNVASPHDYVDDELQPIQSVSADSIGPAGSIWSSAQDMSRWIAFLLRDCQVIAGEALLKPETCEELFEPQTVISDRDWVYPTAKVIRPHWKTYGLGWFQHDYEGRKVDFHTGSLAGLVAIAGMIRDQDIGIYVLGNRDHAEVRHALMYRVFDLFDDKPARDWSDDLKAFYEKHAEAAEEKRAQKIARMKEARQVDTEPSLPVEEYAGVYQDPLYGVIEVTASNGKLFVRYGDRYSGPLEHWHYDTFNFVIDSKDELRLSTFDLGVDGQPERLRFAGREFHRVEASEEAKPEAD